METERSAEMIAPSPHRDLPCSLLSHPPPSRALGGTKIMKPEKTGQLNRRGVGGNPCLFRKVCSWLYFE